MRGGNGDSISERSEYGEVCRPVGMAVSRGLLRGYGDRVGISIFSLLSLSTTK